MSAIFDNSVAIAIEFRTPGNTRKVSTDQIEVDTDKDRLSVSKRLLESDEYKAIRRIDRDAQGYLKTKALPSFFKAGVYLLPHAKIEAAEAYLLSAKAQRAEAIKIFLAAYPGLKEEAKTSLKGLYNEDDYPTTAQMEIAFGMTWNYLDFGVPGKLAKIAPSIFKSEQAKAEQKWAEAEVKIQEALRVAFQGMVGDLAGKLGPQEDGKKKVIQGRTVEKFKEFLSDFKDRNLTDDKDLAVLVAKAEALLEGKSIDKIRTDELFRGQMLAGFSEITGKLTGMITEAGKRKFANDDLPAPDAATEDAA